MKKLRTGGLIAIICVVGMGIVLAARSGGSNAAAPLTGKTGKPSSTAAVSDARPADKTTASPAEIPDEVKFQFLFEHLANIKNKPGPLRNYQPKTGLTDGAYAQLVQLAVEHQQEAAVIEQQAKVIIDNVHAQYPRRLPPGMAPPPPPQELLDLDKQRDALSLRYRDKLRTLIGDEAYNRFKLCIDEEFRPKARGGAVKLDKDPTSLNGRNK